MKILLIIDLQKEFADKSNNSKNYKKCINFINNNKNNYDKIFATIFENNKNNNSNYINKLNWHECKNINKEKSLEFNIDNINIIKKNEYGDYEFFKNIFNKEDDINIIGCDSDACVLATCFNLWDLGFNFYILKDYIYTTSETFNNDIILKIINRNFGNCII